VYRVSERPDKRGYIRTDVFQRKLVHFRAPTWRSTVPDVLLDTRMSAFARGTEIPRERARNAKKEGSGRSSMKREGKRDRRITPK